MQIVWFIRDGDRAQLNSKKYGLKRLSLFSEPLQLLSYFIILKKVKKIDFRTDFLLNNVKNYSKIDF